MAKALLLVDMSNDFIELDGALNCGEAGIAIVPYCTALVEEFLATGNLVFDARDLHDADDFEIASGLFPPHNMRGTPGQNLILPLLQPLQKHQAQWRNVAKKNYNAGFQTTLFEQLTEAKIDELHVVGVCTDICVRYTLNGLYEWKTVKQPHLRLIVHERGVASFNPVGHEDSLRHFREAMGIAIA